MKKQSPPCSPPFLSKVFESNPEIPLGIPKLFIECSYFVMQKSGPEKNQGPQALKYFPGHVCQPYLRFRQTTADEASWQKYTKSHGSEKRHAWWKACFVEAEHSTMLFWPSLFHYHAAGRRKGHRDGKWRHQLPISKGSQPWECWYHEGRSAEPRVTVFLCICWASRRTYSQWFLCFICRVCMTVLYSDFV